MPVFVRWLCLVLFAFVLAGCGGGGATTSTGAGGLDAARLVTAGEAAAPLATDEVRVLGKVTPMASSPMYVRIVPTTAKVVVGQKFELHVYAVYKDNTWLDVCGSSKWTSSDTKVAVVNHAGVLTGIGPGKAQITASYTYPNPANPKAPPLTKTSVAMVTVTGPSLTSFQVTPAEATVPLGRSQQFTARAYYSDGTSADVTSASRWTVPFGRAIITPEGVATSTTVGNSVIVASFAGANNSATLTVTPAELVSLEVSPSSPADLPLGFTQQFTALGIYTDNSQHDVTDQVAWSSSDAAVVAVGSDGLASGVGLGSATVSATLGGVTGATATPLTVTAAKLTSLSLSPENPSVGVTQGVTFTATGTFSDGTTQDLTSTVTWTSSDEGVAVVGLGPTGGVVQTLAAGAATISAADPDPANPVSASTTLTVTPATVVSLSVTPAGASMVEGTTLQYRVDATLSDGSVRDLTTDPSITWTSSFPNLVSIAPDGLATALAAGEGTVNAIHVPTGKTNSVAVTVTPAVRLVSVLVSPATASVTVGETLQYHAEGRYSDGTTRDLTEDPQILWTSSFPELMTISNTPGTKGLATALADGFGTINVIHSSGLGSSTGVNILPSVRLVSLIVGPATITLREGETRQYYATGSYSDGTQRDLTLDPSITWYTSFPDIASVSSTGLVTALKAGSGTIAAISSDPTITPASTGLTVTPGLSKSLERVNVTSDELQADGNMFDPDDAQISADGSVVVFRSRAGNLVPGDTNGVADIFVRDRFAGTTRRVSVGPGGVQANGDSRACAISGNGRYVVYESFASNLVASDTNGGRDVFRHDLVTGTTVKVSVNSAGVAGNMESFGDARPGVSYDGQVVVFSSVATNFVTGASGFQVYCRDFTAGTTTLISRNAAGTPLGGGGGAVSANGNVVTFIAWGTAAGVTNGVQNVFTFDRISGQLARVTMGLNGAQPNDGSYQPALSEDGRYVLFVSTASNLIPGDTSGSQNTFRFDRSTGTLVRVDGNGTSTNGSASMSGDGRYVVYSCTNVPFSSPLYLPLCNVWVKDMDTGTFRQVSLTSTGAQPNGQSTTPWLSSNGRFVSFTSTANNLVPGDTNNSDPTNNSDAHDVFAVGNPFAP